MANPQTARTFDMMSDGRIIAVGAAGQSVIRSGPVQLHLVLNWFEELKRLAPTK